MTASLNTTVHLFEGHVRNPLDLADLTPIWTGTLSDFWQANQEEYPTWGDMRELRDQIDLYHHAHVGGGAQAKHTIVTEPFLAASRPWPTHADGTNKRVGDMTIEDRRQVFAGASYRTKVYFERPAVKEALSKIIDA